MLLVTRVHRDHLFDGGAISKIDQGSTESRPTHNEKDAQINALEKRLAAIEAKLGSGIAE